MNQPASPPALPKIVISAGDPAGIGPDIIALALQNPIEAVIAVAADPAVMVDRAHSIGLRVEVKEVDPELHQDPHQVGLISVLPCPCPESVLPGLLNPANAQQVIQAIDLATDLCLREKYQALVTAPVNKAAINDGGIPFSGHTEWIAERCGSFDPVMMLASSSLRVCLATTHLPLADVPGAITADRLRSVIKVMHTDLSMLYQLESPRIGVCGLNPHAGEGGYLGMEEQRVITPLMQELNDEGMNLIGPLPADTAFTSQQLSDLDAVLAMYHDQGLPVVKHQGFGQVVNVTLGLPVIRTSVDHGTALSLAGTGNASAESMLTSIRLAVEFSRNKSKR